ncbi:putative uncharacterized protein [Clostridium sp. CAG:510]|nr:putative uncharacterized protein [Clostridium sp. CAG:510]
MAAKQTSKKSTTRRKSSSSKSSRQQERVYTEQETELFHEISLILFFAVAVVLFLCNFGILGPVGKGISSILFGLFGLPAYAFSILLFLAIAFFSANGGSSAAVRKIVAGAILFCMAGVICELIAGDPDIMKESYSIKALYQFSSEEHMGGGVLFGSLAYLLLHFLDTIGTVLVVLIVCLISVILLTEKSFVKGVKNGSKRVVELSREDAQRRKELMESRREEAEEERIRREEERHRREETRRLKAEEKENEKILRMDKKVSGVILDTALTEPAEKKNRDDIHEITFNEEPDILPAEEAPMEPAHPIMPDAFSQEMPGQKVAHAAKTAAADSFIHPDILDNIPVEGMFRRDEEEAVPASTFHAEPAYKAEPEPAESTPFSRPKAVVPEKKTTDTPRPEGMPQSSTTPSNVPKKYMFPPLSCLQKGKGGGGDSARELKETAARLQQTLHTFGVNVTITNISQGPSVTRYELQPEQGVKVSKIVRLADDIKLNLAATDIRIEAPIPGKAAIGIEVPNKENTPVALRDLLESKEFKEFPSKIAFAVGKDIAGKVVVADIGKMPHMLIAGATGSGKSVCINTLIMSILYKAHPDEVKLIMVDPKVVELSVYNGIPHLLIPVVTDPKKASAALHWGVTEMEDRYKKFADLNVRDLKGYNEKITAMREKGENVPANLPQMIIIVDELADLMMVCPGEVEDSICRLAQLARAAGIHLIIATQRPSVDVITGLIKANMPSRVAFSVSSGVDSRTILDMNGAEKLLGKGDMLFYPQGYSKPARIQGAFVSDKEVSDVVDFLKNQTLGNVYAEDIEEKIKNIGSSSSQSGATGDGSAVDELFADAGKFIIDKDKASIGMLQRVFKIGFNRAARIMDQLHDYGVVGEDEGTKPRKVLMSEEQFEQLLEEI